MATLHYIEDFKLIENANQLGEYMRIRLKKMQEQYEIIGDVRGIGLLYGVELVLDRHSKEKAIVEAEQVMYKCMEKGLSFKVSQGNVLTLTPPLIIKAQELELAMDILEQSIQEVLAK